MPNAIMALCNEVHEQIRGILPAASTSCSMSCRQAGGEAWGGANSIAIVAGSAQADLSYLKSSSLQLWLFAYELPGARKGLVILVPVLVVSARSRLLP